MITDEEIIEAINNQKSNKIDFDMAFLALIWLSVFIFILFFYTG